MRSKEEFSKNWKSSTKPEKQKKYRENLPLHKRKELVTALLSNDLREKYDTKNIPVREGDTVEIMRGDKKGEEGTVENIDKDNEKLYMTGIEIEKEDGTSTQFPVHPSNVKITDLNLDDEEREKILEETK